MGSKIQQTCDEYKGEEKFNGNEEDEKEDMEEKSEAFASFMFKAPTSSDGSPTSSSILDDSTITTSHGHESPLPTQLFSAFSSPQNPAVASPEIGCNTNITSLSCSSYATEQVNNILIAKEWGYLQSKGLWEYIYLIGTV